MQPPPPTQQGSSRTSGDGSSPQLPSMVSLLAPKLLVIQQRIRVSMCSQFLSSELQQLERFIGIEEEHQEGVEGGEGELLCPNLDIEQLDFKDSVSHPRLRLLSVERKRNSREIFVSFQDKKCLFLCCLCETSSYLATGYVKLAEVTLHGLLATAFTWEEGLLIDFEEITGHTASFLQAVRKARSPFFLLPRGSALSQCVRYCRGKWETWVSPTGDILLQEGNSAQAPLPGECANHEAIV
nr:PREDICTED: uncharacterized protein LOC104148888 [Struthio camelus australis]